MARVSPQTPLGSLQVTTLPQDSWWEGLAALKPHVPIPISALPALSFGSSEIATGAPNLLLNQGPNSLARPLKTGKQEQSLQHMQRG